MLRRSGYRLADKNVRQRAICALVLALSLPGVALAQQAAPRPQQPPAWAQMPRMQLERQFAGPLQDTVIQRWRDPGDGTVCYIYLPITAPHSPPQSSGYVQYGANNIGSISCIAAPAATVAQTKTTPAVAPAKATPRPAPPKAITPTQPPVPQPVQE